jgi:hypothetical protein
VFFVVNILLFITKTHKIHFRAGLSGLRHGFALFGLEPVEQISILLDFSSF